MNRYQGRSPFRLDLKLSVAVMRTNHRQLDGFVEFARAHGIRELEIWNGSGMQTYRRKIAEGVFDDWCGADTHWMDLVQQ